MGGIAEAEVTLSQNAAHTAGPGAPLSTALQVAIKVNQLGVLYHSDTLPLTALLLPDGKTTPEGFVGSWQALPPGSEASRQLPSTVVTNVTSATASLDAAHLFVMAHKSIPGTEVLYVTGAVAPPGGQRIQLLLELRFALNAPGIAVVAKSASPALCGPAIDALAAVLGA